ncbi:hypothetical protein THAOC_36390 [Thalassiosira oceanica]|uniref:Uncharacterized protein n=1 Tax=Thalassiosira oceanica TaxID=159749 RepID=K0R8A0_THAOC|nr:hypothetical protein THAOC_36390 [Thalassiosira oceanica]|eukprot:EJK45026.1 hypothetical protein THAOC_36390 [Thalassiosira oceanica]
MTALEGNTTIVNFTICENSRVGTNEGSRVLSAFLLRRKCPMVSLRLDALGISLSSFQILAPGIGRPGLCGRRVEELRLTGNDLSANTEEKRATLYHSLTNLSWLKTLDLEGCKLGNSGCSVCAMQHLQPCGYFFGEQQSGRRMLWNVGMSSELLGLPGSSEQYGVSSWLFDVIRQMVPALLRFPSAERLRFEARIRQMEVENRKVMNENERLSKVEMENEALRKQINQLKRDLNYSIGVGGRKRSRRM